MKKIGYILALLLEAAALGGAYSIHYFTKRKLGMVRYLNYKNMSWEGTYPVQTFIYTGVIVMVILTAVVFWLFLKRYKKTGRLVKGMNLLMLLMTAAFVLYALTVSSADMIDYYYLLSLFGLTAFVQILKAGTAVVLSAE